MIQSKYHPSAIRQVIQSILFSLVLFISVQSASAQVPRAFSYQGVLTDKNGKPVADGEHAVRFVLYATRTGQIELYTKQVAINTVNGFFTTLLDSIPTSLTFDRQLYLGITVDGTTEMKPRTPLAAVPYALNAPEGILTLIEAEDASINITRDGQKATLSVADKGITTAKIQDGAVTNAKIASMSWLKLTNMPVGMPPTGPASGDLQGTYPGPKLKPTGVSAGNYTNPTISVDADGRITTAKNGVIGTDTAKLPLPYVATSTKDTLLDLTTTSQNANAIAIRGVANTRSTITSPSGAITGINTYINNSNEAFGVVGLVGLQAANAAGVMGMSTSTQGGNGVYGVGYHGVVGKGYDQANSVGVTGIIPTGNTTGYAGDFYGGRGLKTDGLVVSVATYPASNNTVIPAAGAIVVHITNVPGGTNNATLPGGWQGRVLYIINDDDTPCLLGGGLVVPSGKTRMLLFTANAWRIIDLS